MASSRLERLGTIFTRITSLMKCGAMNPLDKPLWYEVYQVFPPIDEPSFSRRVAIKEIKPIFYPEDRIRAKFHQDDYARSMKIETLEGGIATSDFTQKVISLTADIMKTDPKLKEDDAIQKAIEKFTAENTSMLEKPRSMFKPKYRKTDNVTTVDMVNSSPQVDASTLKNIAQKNIDVTSILVDQKENENYKLKRNSILKDFKNASKKQVEENVDTDDSSREK